MDFAELQDQLSRLAPTDGVTPAEILELPDAVAAAVRKAIRGAMTEAEFAAELGLAPPETRIVVTILIEKGYLREKAESQPAQPGGKPRYTVNFARMRRRSIPVDL